jgi:protease PrsW
VVLLIGASAYLLILRALVTTGNANFYPSLLVVGASTAPIAVLVFAWGWGPPHS